MKSYEIISDFADDEQFFAGGCGTLTITLKEGKTVTFKDVYKLDLYTAQGIEVQLVGCYPLLYQLFRDYEVFGLLYRQPLYAPKQDKDSLVNYSKGKAPDVKIVGYLEYTVDKAYIFETNHMSFKKSHRFMPKFTFYRLGWSRSYLDLDKKDGKAVLHFKKIEKEN